MSKRSWLATGLSMLVLLGLTSVRGQKADTGPRARELNPDVVAVRLVLGVGDTEPDTWGGSVEVDKGEVVGVEGWRFRPGDRVTGPGSWQARSRLRPQAKKAQAKKAQAKKAQQAKKAAGADHKEAPVAQPIGPVAPNIVVVTVKAPGEAVLAVRTDHGKFDVPLADLAAGGPRRYLDGRVEVQRVPPSAGLVDSPDQDDYPAAAADPRGAVWVAYVAHAARGPATLAPSTERPKSFENFVPGGGGDQVRLLRFAGGRAGEPIDVTSPGRDVWRPAVAVDGAGTVLLTWSENRDGNADLFARRYDPGAKSWAEPQRLTSDPGADLDASLAVAPDGTIWLAWQAWRDGRAAVILARADRVGEAVAVSPPSANAWSPALAVDPSGRVHVAYDTYAAGSYDVHLRTRQADGTLAAAVPVADSPRFEARPALAVDARGRVWVAYEERDLSWGKDFGSADAEGAALYRGGAVRVRCLDGARRLDAPDPVADLSTADRLFNGFPRLAADRVGRVWLAYRHRLDPRNNGVGGAWVEAVTALSNRGWSPPQVVPHSDACSTTGRRWSCRARGRCSWPTAATAA
jgi:hypothetical protein